MNYSKYFNFGSDPEMGTRTRNVTPAWVSSAGGTAAYNYVSDGVEDKKANEDFDNIMAGYDAETAKYTNTLKSIYDSYQKYSDEYTGEIKPIIDALNGDIEGMEGYIGDYNKLLSDNKDTFLNGIVLDPNANRTRSEYMGGVADQYATAEDALRRSQISQGLNPFENKGASRELAMNRAKDIGGASGQAYTDWRAGFNRDKQAQQNAVGQYIGLKNNTLDAQGKIINARTKVGDFQGNILSSKIEAGKNRAAGYEGLTSLSEARRQEALGLGQQQQENARQTADIKQQLNAKLTSRDKYLSTSSFPTSVGLYQAST